MDYVFYQAMAVNGFDTFGHFLRAGLLVNTCSTYAVQPQDECISKFSNPPSTNASARSLSGLDIVLQRTAAVLRGEDPDDVLRRTGGQETKTGPNTQRTRTQPQVTATATPSPSPSPTSTPQVAPAAPAPSATPDSGTVNDVMDYLFGKDGL
jgi:hypothetical protein